MWKAVAKPIMHRPGTLVWLAGSGGVQLSEPWSGLSVKPRTSKTRLLLLVAGVGVDVDLACLRVEFRRQKAADNSGGLGAERADQLYLRR